MNEEETIDEMIEDTVLATMEALNTAMIIGDYKKAKELLDALLPTVKKDEKDKRLEDVMVT